MKKLIGHCGVDAGMLMGGDPCYFVGKDSTINERCDKWSTACKDVFCKPETNDRNVAMDVYGLGVAIATTHGDGVYPVYLSISKTGKRSIIVNLD